MNVEIKIVKLISNDIRSRANVEIIKSAIDVIDENITLDFTGVTFISRSFADELYNLQSDHKNISLDGMVDFVSSMYKTVVQGRLSKRVFKHETSEIKVCEDMGSLSSFLSTI